MFPRLKHAVKVLRQLSGSARAAADEVSVAVLQSEDGVEAIVKKLKEHFQPHLEAAMPKAFEKAVYGEARKGKESMQDYIIRSDKAFKELAEEGVALEDNVREYILYRHANLNATQEDQVVTWTSGQYGREAVVRALRKLEKVQKDKGSKAFVQEGGETEEAAESFATNELEDDQDIENYVYMNEGDMNQIFEEQSLHEALATYQQVRKAIRDQRMNRGWSKGRGKGFSKIFHRRCWQQGWISAVTGQQGPHREFEVEDKMCSLWSCRALGKGVHFPTGRIRPEPFSCSVDEQKWREFKYVRQIRFCACVFKPR